MNFIAFSRSFSFLSRIIFFRKPLGLGSFNLGVSKYMSYAISSFSSNVGTLENFLILSAKDFFSDSILNLLTNTYYLINKKYVDIRNRKTTEWKIGRTTLTSSISN